MTRKEQIAQEADKFAGVNYDCETEADAFYHAVQKEAFVAGAAYADEHPDLYSVTRKAVEREREYLIDKACEYLKNDMIANLAFQGRLYRFEIIDGIVTKFRKHMEEQQ